MDLRTGAGAALLALVGPLPLGTAAQADSIDVTCEAFSSQLEAQRRFDAAPEKYETLDVDDDGIACEVLIDGGRTSSTATVTRSASPKVPPRTLAPPTTRPPHTRPTGAPRAGMGAGDPGGPADLALPLGLALTTLAVGGAAVALHRRRQERADGD